jgi:hypothetical protein
MSNTIQVNPLKIKGKYISIHGSPFSEKNHSSQNHVPLKMQNAPSVRPTEVAGRQRHPAVDTIPTNTPLRKPQDSDVRN